MRSNRSSADRYGWAVQPCERAGCSNPPTVMLSVDLQGRVIYWDPLARARRPGAALCFNHATEIAIPEGWTICDRRGRNPIIHVPPVQWETLRIPRSRSAADARPHRASPIVVDLSGPVVLPQPSEQAADRARAPGIEHTEPTELPERTERTARTATSADIPVIVIDDADTILQKPSPVPRPPEEPSPFRATDLWWLRDRATHEDAEHNPAGPLLRRAFTGRSARQEAPTEEPPTDTPTTGENDA